MTGMSAVRNTCFAILSSVESDLRELLEHEIPLIKGNAFLPPDVRTIAASRYAFDTKDAAHRPQPIDVELLTYADFGDLAKIILPSQVELTQACQADFSAIANEIESFVPVRNRVCHSHPLEEDDLPRCLDFGKALLATHSQLPWTALRETHDLLQTNPTFVLRLSIPSYWNVGANTIRHNLPFPDYDETGFLGRVSDRREIRKHLLAAHPVITIVGEGGVGKSALAVHCLYDLLNLSERSPYDAIIWTSLKTKTLTASGIEDLKGSITSTIGILESATKELGGSFDSPQSIEKTIEDVLEYMSLFRILLVVDNFETVSDNSLRPLLTSIPVGSKVLLTSRVGLGELEIRYKLGPLDTKTSISLMRRFAKSLNVEILYAVADNKLDKYVSSLYFNPLLIKWFVQSVSMGSDPEKLASKRNAAFDSVLQYCFENLFSRLRDEEREVLLFLAASRRPLTPTELLFLLQKIGKIDSFRLDKALSTLHSSSMLKHLPADAKSGDGTIQVSLTDVASDYIARFAPPAKETFDKIQTAYKELRLQAQLASVRQATYKFDLFAVRARTTDQRICAFHLNTALEFSKVSDYASARKYVAEAKNLLPSFAESYRISALIESKAGETYKACREIEEAAQYEPDSALIHYHYCPAINRTESTDCMNRVTQYWSQVRQVPVEWGFSRRG